MEQVSAFVNDKVKYYKRTEEYEKSCSFCDEYKQDKELPDFKKYDLIYGWNSSGKTTLSKIFKILESGKSEEFKDLKWII